jgi:hypothetical protein
VKLSFRRGLNVDEVKCGSYQQRASRLKDATQFRTGELSKRVLLSKEPAQGTRDILSRGIYMEDRNRSGELGIMVANCL